MGFLSILLCGVDISVTVKKFCADFFRRAQLENGGISSDACQFINDIFRAIGFEFQMTQPDLYKDSFEWSTDFCFYTFNYQSSKFDLIEKFLIGICAETSRLQHENDRLQQKDSPVEWLIELIAMWSHTYRRLCSLETVFDNRRFEEPVSLINISLLKGFHKLRMEYGESHPVLNGLCVTLLRSAVNGLHYIQINSRILGHLMDIFEDDYSIFVKWNEDALTFYNVALKVDVNKSASIIFQHLKNMLQQTDVSNSDGKEQQQQQQQQSLIANKKLSILRDYLTSDDMLAIYYTLMKKYNIKRTMVPMLNFLDTLQSKLVTVDCFKREFIEEILHLVFHKDDTIQKCAAKLYLHIIRRRFDDNMILKHLLEYYLTHWRSTLHLSDFLGVFWKDFSPLHQPITLFQLIITPETDQLLRFLTIRLLIESYTCMLKNKPKYIEDICWVLRNIPILMQNLDDASSTGILLEIYRITKYEKLIEIKPDIIDWIHNLEYLLIGLYMEPKIVQYPLLLNIFAEILHFMSITKNFDKISKITKNIFTQFLRLHKQLSRFEYNFSNQTLSLYLFEKFSSTLIKLSICLKPTYGIYESIDVIVEVLKKLLLETNRIDKMATELGTYCDVYALDALVSCLIRISNDDQKAKDTVQQTIPMVSTYLRKFFNKSKNVKKLSITRIRVLFSNYCKLFMVFTKKSAVFNLELTNLDYEIIVTVLLTVNFDNSFIERDEQNRTIEDHPKRDLEQKHMLMNIFARLHGAVDIEIPSYAAWKICIFYGLSKYKDFEEDLKQIVMVLSMYHFDVYQNIISFLIYKLYSVDLKISDEDRVNALKAHNDLINHHLKLGDPALFKVHLILDFINLIDKLIAEIKINSISNRLECLKHLNIFMIDLLLYKSQAYDSILKAIVKLKGNLLNINELKSIKLFTNNLKKCWNNGKDILNDANSSKV